MIYLQELFDDLSYGELSNQSIGKPIGKIDNSFDHPKLVSFINAGLLDLYTRFRILERTVNIPSILPGETYFIPSDSGSDGDSSFQSNQDFIRLLAAYDSEGLVLPIDEPSALIGIEGVPPDSVKNPSLEAIEDFSIVYQAAYPKIEITEQFDPETLELHFPRYLKKALLLYVAHKATFKMPKGNERTSTYWGAYESECQDIKTNGLLPDISFEKQSFTNNGWV